MTSFSSSFPKHSSSMIGLYDLGAVGSFLLGFLSITTRACRQRVGWYPWSRQALRSEVSPIGKDSKTCLTIGQVIPDGPGADVGDTEAKACLTSSTVRGEWSKVWVAVHWSSKVGDGGPSLRGSPITGLVQSALGGGGGKKVLRNNSAQLSGVAAKPVPSLRGGMGVVLVPMPHLARDHMLAGLAASHMEV